MKPYFGTNYDCTYLIPTIKFHKSADYYLSIEINWLRWWGELVFIDKYDKA